MNDAGLAALAAAAYSEAPTWVFGDVHVRVTEDDAGLVVAFRGTVPTVADDWFRDLDCWPTDDPVLGWCHTGFLTGARAALPSILDLAPKKPITFTGHSLGGAMAIPTAALVAHAGFHPVALVTFGAPRVGFGKLKEAVAGFPVRQYHHGSDPVPDVPLPYEHVSALIQLGPEGKVPNVGDHSIALYVSSLKGSSQ